MLRKLRLRQKNGFLIKKTCIKISGKQKQPSEVFCKKKVFWKISQISRENTCVGVFSIIVQASTLPKIDSSTGVFLWNLRNFLEHLFWRATNDYFWIKKDLLAIGRESQKVKKSTLPKQYHSMLSNRKPSD